MAKLYADIINDAETLVQDAGIDTGSAGANAVFATAELDALIPSALSRISYLGKPWQVKTTKSTVASTRDITLTTGDKWRLLGIDKVEYLTAQEPPVYRNVSRFGDVVSIKINNRPPEIADIYFFWNKVHLLQSALGTSTATWAVYADTDEAATTLVIDAGSATGTVNEMSTVAITGDSTTYYVIEAATIATNKVTLNIWPPLTADAAENAVVTLSLTGSTLDIPLEGYLARWLAAQACISKATKSYSQVNQAIATITLAATAISAIAAVIAKAEAATTGDIALARAQIALSPTAITLANVEFDKVSADVVLAAAALASGTTLINTIPVGGGASEYMRQASSNIGVSQGRLINGQSYLQEAAADNANAVQYLNAAGAELKTAGEKANEAIASLRLVATRLQVSQGGLRYEEWGRREKAQVEAELRAYGGYPSSKKYPED